MGRALFLIFVLISLTVISSAIPIITFHEPLNNANISQKFIFFNISSDESLSNAILEWRNDTGKFNFTMSNTTLKNWFLNLTESNTSLTDGNYSYIVYGENTTGNWNSTELRKITIDTKSPEINLSISTPTNNSKLKQNWIFVNVTFSDLTSGVKNITYYLYNSTSLIKNISFINPSSPNSTNFTNLNDGIYFFNVTVYDYANNKNSTLTRKITLDTTPPEWNLISPGNYTNKANLTIKFNLTDPSGLNESSIKIYFDNIQKNFTNRTIAKGLEISFNVSNLKHNETHAINITASDSLGNILQDSFNFKVDLVNPNSVNNYKIIEPLLQTNISNRVLNGSTLTLNWSLADDNGTFIDHYELWVRNRTYDFLNSRFTNWSDWYILNNSIPNSTTNLTLTLENNYQYELNLTSVDAAGNKNSSILNVTVDGKGPQLAFDLNKNPLRNPVKWTNKVNLTLWVMISDISGIRNDSINVSVNGGLILYPDFKISPNKDNETLYNITFNLTGLSSSDNVNYTITITAKDVLGNKNTSISYNITTDHSSPQIVLTNLSSPISNWFRDSAIYKVSCSDSLSGINAYFSNESSYNSWIITENSSINFTINENGNKTYLFKCRDKAGNVNSTEINIAVDKNGPSFKVSTRNPEGTGIGTTVTVSIEYSDGESGIKTNSCSMDISPSVSSSDEGTLDCTSTKMSRTYTNLKPATEYTVTVRVKDKVGHSETYSWSFTTKSSTISNTGSTGGGPGGDSTSGTNKTEKKKSLAWKNPPEEISVVEGENKSFELTLKNNGEVKLENIALSISGDINASLSKNNVTLDVDEEEKIKVKVFSSGYDVGVYYLNISAKKDNLNIVAKLRVKIQPKEEEKKSINESILNLSVKINKLKEELEEINRSLSNESKIGELYSTLKEIESLYNKSLQSLKKGDYAEAIELKNLIDDKIKAVEKTLSSIKELREERSNIWLYILIAIIVLAIIGIILYVSIIPEKPQLEEKKERVIEKLSEEKPKASVISDLIKEREEFEKEVRRYDFEKEKEKTDRRRKKEEIKKKISKGMEKFKEGMKNLLKKR